jgi:hypothetical protein
MNHPDLEARADQYELAQLLYDAADHDECWHMAAEAERDLFLNLADVATRFATAGNTAAYDEGYDAGYERGREASLNPLHPIQKGA